MDRIFKLSDFSGPQIEAYEIIFRTSNSDLDKFKTITSFSSMKYSRRVQFLQP